MSIKGWKIYPFIGDDDDKGEEKIEVLIKKDEKGRPIYMDGEGNRLFTQEHLNKEIGTARAKASEKNADLIQKLEDIQAQAETSEAMKQELQQQIENLQAQNLSKEEQMAQKIKTLESSLQKTQETMAAERDNAVKLWEEERVANALRAAADEHRAISFEQIYGLLRNRTQLKPLIGEDGKPTGEHEVIVSLDVTDENGNVEKQQLHPPAALKIMKSMEGRYDNLFNSPEKSGVGGNNAGSGDVVKSEIPPPEALENMASYEAWAKANLKG